MNILPIELGVQHIHPRSDFGGARLFARAAAHRDISEPEVVRVEEVPGAPHAIRRKVAFAILPVTNQWNDKVIFLNKDEYLYFSKQFFFNYILVSSRPKILLEHFDVINLYIFHFIFWENILFLPGTTLSFQTS